MSPLARILVAAPLLVACAQTVNPSADAVVATDTAASADAAPADSPFVNTPGIACGPNRCRGQEICCNAACGVCAFAGECVDHGCAGRGGDGGR